MDNTLKAEELRIGNQIKQGIVVTIGYNQGIWGCTVTQSLFSSGHDWKFIKDADLSPIELSPEWLDRMGAIFPHKDFRCQIGMLCFYWNPNASLI